MVPRLQESFPPGVGTEEARGKPLRDNLRISLLM